VVFTLFATVGVGFFDEDDVGDAGSGEEGEGGGVVVGGG